MILKVRCYKQIVTNSIEESVYSIWFIVCDLWFVIFGLSLMRVVLFLARS